MALPRTGCPKCDYNGFRITEGKLETCECIIRRRLHTVYEGIGIPRVLYDARLEQYAIKNDGKPNGSTELDKGLSRAKEEARDWFSSYLDQMAAVFTNDENFQFSDPGKDHWQGRTIILCGNRGSGKSLLAVCVAKRAIELRLPPKIIQWADVIESCYDFDREDDENSFSGMAGKLASAQPIIIENFSMNYETRRHPTDSGGSGGLNPVTRRRLDSLFSKVYQKGLVTVLTTSHSVTSLEEQDAYGPLFSSIISDAYKRWLPSPMDTQKNTKKGT